MKYLLVIIALLLSCKHSKQGNTKPLQLTNKNVAETDTIKINEPANREQYIIEKDKLLGVVN